MKNKALTDEQIKYRVIADTISILGSDDKVDGKDVIIIRFEDRFKVQDSIVKELKKKDLLA